MRSISPRLAYTLVAILAILAVTIGLGQTALAHSSSPHVSATDRVKANTPPALFSDAQVATIAAAVHQQQGPSDTAMTSWWATHGSTIDDKAFVRWVEGQVPAPPAHTRRAEEMKEVGALGASRTRSGIAAATWLEVYGKKDIWKLYLHDQRELETSATGQKDKKDLKLVLSMSKTVADALAVRYQQSAPYVLDPSLRTDHVVKTGAVCPCSYPSRHAARAAASRAYLGHVAPRRLADYSWMESQVDFSRIYMAGHVRSDITAGTMLGDMIADYVLVSRGRMPIPTA